MKKNMLRFVIKGVILLKFSCWAVRPCKLLHQADKWFKFKTFVTQLRGKIYLAYYLA